MGALAVDLDLNGRLVQYDFRQPTGTDTLGDIDFDGNDDVHVAFFQSNDAVFDIGQHSCNGPAVMEETR